MGGSRGWRKWSEERFASDAPEGYSMAEARAWAAGWNAAAAEANSRAESGRIAREAEAAERVRLGLDG